MSLSPLSTTHKLRGPGDGKGSSYNADVGYSTISHGAVKAHGQGHVIGVILTSNLVRQNYRCGHGLTLNT